MCGIAPGRRERWHMWPCKRRMMITARRTVVATVITLLTAATLPAQAPAPPPPDKSYLFFVASEAIDQVALVRYGPKGILVEHRTSMNLNPAEPTRPEGLSVAPDGRFYYVTTRHGFPTCELLKVKIAADSNPRESQPPDTIRGGEPLGVFPDAVQVAPDGAYAWIANSNAAGDSTPSSVSVVYLESMVEVAGIQTCVAPRGSRLTADGSKHYSVCMRDDLLVEIDARAMTISRRVVLTRGSEHGIVGAFAPQDGAASGGTVDTSHAAAAPVPAAAACSPTWVQPNADGSKIYVACNQSNDVVEIDGSAWTMRRRIPMGDGVYHLALTHDGKRLIGTNQRGQSVSIVDLATAREVARLPTRRRFPANVVIGPDDRYAFMSVAVLIATTRRFPAGVVISPDDRYAFVSVAGTGTEPGTVEIIDLAALRTVATIDVGPQAGGIDFWKMERAKSP